MSASIPTVHFSLRRTQLKFPRVLEDYAHAARLVAEYFLGRSFTNFCCCSDANNWFYKERGLAFIKALGDTGHNCAWLRWLESASCRFGVIVRKSSDNLTIKHQGVARSLRHIWEHSHEPICIIDLVSVSAMSRRGLHKALLEHFGRTPGRNCSASASNSPKNSSPRPTAKSRPSRPTPAIKASTASASPASAPPACRPHNSATRCGAEPACGF